MTHRAATATVALALVAAACAGGGSDGATPDSGAAGSTTSAGSETVGDNTEAVVDDGRLTTAWQDFGWASTVTADGSVTVDLADFGGWIVASPDLSGRFISLRIAVDVDADTTDEFLSVQLGDAAESVFPVVVPPMTRSGSRATATITIGELDPIGIGFDRIIFTANEALPSPTIMRVSQIELERSTEPAPVDDGQTADPSTDATETTTTEAFESDDVDSSLPVATVASGSIECAADTFPISANIYGINQKFGNMPDEDWSIGAASRRWGGNATSRYNWRTGDWNTAFDYYFQNVSDDSGEPAHLEFLRENDEFGLTSSLTIPAIGWVAKDDTSASFPVTEFGEQQDTDPFNANLGNGIDASGDFVVPDSPLRTSTEFTPDDAAEWIETMNADAANGGPAAPFMYFIDNEPMLWDSTHRDIVTEPLGYDELLERTIAYATAVRSAQPDALIAGPTVWGWPAYFFSAIDAVDGFDRTPDRQQHGNTPLIEWYLQELTDYENETGLDLLDVLDVHFYPQDGSYSDDVDETAVARRLRTTRSLWDPNYFDESWIEDNVGLIPRMQDWVDEFSPGTKLSLGEYSFGAERHISGGLAQAEALGRFGQNELFAAYYWDVPPSGSPVYWAFRTYRDYDGNGSTFGELSVPTTTVDLTVSLFASATADADRNVAVLLNLSPEPIAGYGVDVSQCGRTTATAYQYSDGSTALAPVPASIDGDLAAVDLPAYSITVLELT